MTQTQPEQVPWLALRRDRDGNLVVLRTPGGDGFAWEPTEVETDAATLRMRRWTALEARGALSAALFPRGRASPRGPEGGVGRGTG